ncbi:Uncharacterised protein [uncultured archaeon]|nr:Uncharacterised protein [uncultured archaeon]
MRIPQTARRRRAGPCRIERENVGPDKDLVLNDQRDFATAFLDKIRQAHSHQTGFEAVAEKVSGSDSGIGIEPGDVVRMVVVPHHARALGVRVIVLCLTGGETRVQQLEVVRRRIRHARAVFASARRWRKPCHRSPIADPGHKTAMKMSRSRIVAIPAKFVSCIREDTGHHSCRSITGVHWQDVLGRKHVGEGELDRHAFLCYNNAAEVPRGVRPLAQRHGRAVAPQRSWTTKGRVQSVLELYDLE